MSSPAFARLMGVPTLEHHGTSRTLPFERRSQLLVLVALERGWVGRSEVAAMLWPDQGSRLAATGLLSMLFRLPLVAWGRLVQAEGGALRFDCGTDLAAFELALIEGRLADAAPSPPPSPSQLLASRADVAE